MDVDLIDPLENLHDPSSQSCSDFHDGPEQRVWNEQIDFKDQFLFAQAFRVLAQINWYLFEFALNDVARWFPDCPEIVQFAEENLARLKIHRAFFTALEEAFSAPFLEAFPNHTDPINDEYPLRQQEWFRRWITSVRSPVGTLVLSLVIIHGVSLVGPLEAVRRLVYAYGGQGLNLMPRVRDAIDAFEEDRQICTEFWGAIFASLKYQPARDRIFAMVEDAANVEHNFIASELIISRVSNSELTM